LGTLQYERGRGARSDQKRPAAEIGLKSVVTGTRDAKTASATIEENGVVNCVKCCTEVEREKKSGEPIISCKVDRIKDKNERGFSRVMSAIS